MSRSKTDPAWTVFGVLPLIRNSYCKYMLQAKPLLSLENPPTSPEELAAQFEWIKPAIPSKLDQAEVERLFIEEDLLFVEFLPEMGTRFPITPSESRKRLKKYSKSDPALVAQIRSELAAVEARGLRLKNV